MFTNKIFRKVKDQECLVKIHRQITIKEYLFTNKNLILEEVTKELDLPQSDWEMVNMDWSLICPSEIF